MQFRRTLLASSSFALIAAGPLAVFAANNDTTSANDDVTLEEIVVTASKTGSDSIQKTPMSITAITGDTLIKEGRTQVQDILKDVPGVTLTNTSQGYDINIRGIASGALPNSDADPGVAMNFDGSYASPLIGGASQAAYYDIARVEVLRGPQGTLYGRNAEAGVVNVISNDPELGKYDASGQLEMGNYNLVHATGAFNAPISDTLAVRAAVTTEKHNGYYTSGGDDADVSAARVKLLFNPSDDLKLLFGGEFTNQGGAVNVGGRGAGISGWEQYGPTSNPYNDVTTDGGVSGTIPGTTQSIHTYKTWAQLDANVGIGVLTVLPAHQHSTDNSIQYSETAAYEYKQDPGYAWGNEDSVEARLASLPSSPIQWVGGVFYYRGYNYDDTTNPSVSITTVEQSSKAVFANATLPLSDNWRFIAGARETWDNKSFTSSSSPLAGLDEPGFGNASWNRFDWKAGVEDNLNANSMAYFTVATGYRPGAINTGSSAQVLGANGTAIANQELFTKPEELLSFELGIKNKLLDNHLIVNADIYYYDYKNRQYSFFNATEPVGTICPNGQVAVDIGDPAVCLVEENAAKATTKGAEAQVQYLFTNADRVDASAAYLDAKASATQEVLLSSGTTVNIDGDTMPNSPKLQLNFGYQHTFNFTWGSLVPRIDARYTSRQYLGSFDYLDSNVYIAAPYWVDDLTVTYTSADGKWSLSGYDKNMFQSYFKTSTDGSTSTAGDPRLLGMVFNVHM